MHNPEGQALEERVSRIINMLPEGASFVRHYVEYGMVRTDCNSAYHLGCALGILTQTVPSDLHILHGSKLHAMMYILCVGPSTNSRKSTAVRIAAELLEEALPDRLMSAPGSYQRLIDQLCLTPQRLLTYEEFATFLSTTERGYLMPMKAQLTAIYDGSPVSRELVDTGAKKRPGPTSCKNPRLSLLAACAPNFLSRYAEAVDWTDGFFARFLTIYATRAREMSRTGSWPERHQALIQLLQGIARLGLPVNPGAQTPYCAGISDEAMPAWTKWIENHNELASRHPKSSGAVGRAQGMALKTCLVLCWEQFAFRELPPPGWTIPPAVLEPAMEIAQIHLESALYLAETAGGSVAMNDRQAVVQAMSTKGRAMVLGQISKSSSLLRRRTMEILETLLEEGVIKKVALTDGVKQVEGYEMLPRDTAEVELTVAAPVDHSSLFQWRDLQPGEEPQGAKVLQMFPQSAVAPVAPALTLFPNDLGLESGHAAPIAVPDASTVVEAMRMLFPPSGNGDQT